MIKIEQAKKIAIIQWEYLARTGDSSLESSIIYLGVKFKISFFEVIRLSQKSYKPFCVYRTDAGYFCKDFCPLCQVGEDGKTYKCYERGPYFKWVKAKSIEERKMFASQIVNILKDWEG